MRFLLVETLLCLAASFLVNHRHFGGGTARRSPEPVPSLARSFSRSPSSVLAKMATWMAPAPTAPADSLAGVMLCDDPARFSGLYRLPDFLNLENGGELALLGQDELDISVPGAGLRDQIAQHLLFGWAHEITSLP